MVAGTSYGSDPSFEALPLLEPMVVKWSHPSSYWAITLVAQGSRVEVGGDPELHVSRTMPSLSTSR